MYIHKINLTIKIHRKQLTTKSPDTKQDNKQTLHLNINPTITTTGNNTNNKHNNNKRNTHTRNTKKQNKHTETVYNTTNLNKKQEQTNTTPTKKHTHKNTHQDDTYKHTPKETTTIILTKTNTHTSKQHNTYKKRGGEQHH